MQRLTLLPIKIQPCLQCGLASLQISNRNNTVLTCKNVSTWFSCYYINWEKLITWWHLLLLPTLRIKKGLAICKLEIPSNVLANRFNSCPQWQPHWYKPAVSIACLIIQLLPVWPHTWSMWHNKTGLGQTAKVVVYLQPAPFNTLTHIIWFLHNQLLTSSTVQMETDRPDRGKCIYSICVHECVHDIACAAVHADSRKKLTD